MHVYNIYDKKAEEILGCTFSPLFLSSDFEKFSQAVKLIAVLHMKGEVHLNILIALTGHFFHKD